ncbi:MAG TPA: cytochrome P450 [Steroidobacteraceae bacterium]|nr:cytochrome P450 [Steroidobacteraceae bacterium]
MSIELAATPSHVPPELVVDFDYRDFPGHDSDVHLAWKRLHEGPDLFWSPRHGGYWVATRAEDIDVMQIDHERFSHRSITVPPEPGRAPLAPLEYDPPRHGPLRSVLSPAFGPRPMQELDADLRQLSSELLDAIQLRGQCEFVDAYAKRLPIVTFLRLVDLPLDDRDELLELTELSVRPKSQADQLRAFSGLQQYIGGWIAQRRTSPGKDLLSRMVNARIGDRAIDEVELGGMMPNVIFGGLDTVASALSFTARCLAENPGVRRRLIDDPKLIPTAIEEFLRRFGIPNTARVVTRDMDYKSVKFRAGDVVLLPKTLHGLDERRFPDPLEIDFGRVRRPHAAFGDGPHRCPGSFLARLEMRVFLEQWLERIPDFRITPGERVRTSSGAVNGVLHLPLSWH